MITPRPTKLSCFSAPYIAATSINPKMKLRKFSIPTTFVTVCWFSSLFAICLFSFLYLHPRDTDNCINIININESKTIASSSKYVSNETIIGVSSKLDQTRIVPGPTPSSKGKGKGRSDDSFVDPPSSKGKSSDSIIEPPSNVKLSLDELPSIESKSNGSIIELVSSVPSTETKSNSSIAIELPTSKDAPSNEAPTNATIVEVIVDQTKTTIEEESDEEYDKIPSFDVFANPPSDSSRKERMLWVKEKLQETKLIMSTSKTQNFDQKIQAFLSSDCRVRIFLTWIYPANLFSKREVFALESMLKAHRQGCVVILSRTMDSNSGRSILKPILDRGYKVLTIAPDFHFLVSGTPGEGWLERLESGKVDPGTVPITLNLSNLLRYAVLYKYGGVYFDNDMIILKDVSGLKNTIGVLSTDHDTRSWSTFSNAVLIFDNWHPLLWKFIEEFATNFDGFKWGFNGPDLATRVVSKALHDSHFQFNIIAPIAFYPMDGYRVNRLFEKTPKKIPSWAKGKFEETYGIHLWNRQSRSLKIEKKSVLGKVISNHCIICQDVYDS